VTAEACVIPASGTTGFARPSAMTSRVGRHAASGARAVRRRPRLPRDDCGEPVIHLAPPLICTQEHFDEIGQIFSAVLTEAWTKIQFLRQ
jgi:4-aminobutyrate aminotransferase-like enzyme